MTVSLTNTSRRMRAFTLPHETYCQARGQCACSQSSGRAPRRLASSLTLAADTACANLDDAVVAVPDIARAIRAGELRLEREPPSPAKTTTTETNLRRVSRKARGDA